MIKRIIFLFFFIGVSLLQVSWNKPSNEIIRMDFEDYVLEFYQGLNNDNLNFQAFKQALGAYIKLASEEELNNKTYLTLIDMSQPSATKRFFLINMLEKKVVHESIVAHGRNSGSHMAKSFSNKVGSYQSSIGFFRTAETYYGKHGLSLRLDGLEYSNDNARKRAIVIHAADYVSTQFIKKFGRLGRSLGCPSLPRENYDQVIDKIKDGSLLYIYYPQKDYLEKSALANQATTQADKFLASVSNFQ